MRLSDLQYHVPKQAPASQPSYPRDSCNLLVMNRFKGDSIATTFKSIIDYVEPGDCFVVNETRCLPALLKCFKEKTDSEVEVLLIRELNAEEKIWEILVDPAGKIRLGHKLYFEKLTMSCEVIDTNTSRGRTVRFDPKSDVHWLIEKRGLMPLPSYIERRATKEDRSNYQTIFARTDKSESVAPPTAGLHFTRELVKELKAKGAKFAKLSLNIGANVFEYITHEEVSKHKMFSEHFEMSRENSDVINRALKQKKKVIAVGCSVVRALESSILTTGITKANTAWTDKYIGPNYDFRIVNALLTNFHEPVSPQLALVVGFAGLENTMKAYRKALKLHYRTFAYGDAMLIV